MGCGQSGHSNDVEPNERVQPVVVPQATQRNAVVVEQPAAGGVRARPAGSVVVQPTPAPVAQTLALVGGSRINVGAALPGVAIEVELQLANKAATLTEVEVLLARPPAQHWRLELVVAGVTAARGELRPAAAAAAAGAAGLRAAGAAGGWSRCRLRLDAPAGGVAVTLRATCSEVSAVTAPEAGTTCGEEEACVLGVCEVVARGLPSRSPCAALALALACPPGWKLARPPPYWRSAGTESTSLRRIDVDDHTEVFQALLDATWKSRFTRDRTGAAPGRLMVRKVQRVEAPLLWNRFAQARHELAALRGGRCTRLEALCSAQPEAALVRTQRLCQAAPAILGPCEERVNEHYLFHGTSPTKAMGIIRDGFDLGRAGTASGKMFGPGAYFAEASSKFDEYAAFDAFSGLFAMLFCRVLCGEMYRTLHALDSKVAADPEFMDRYDGVLGDREASAGTYREFVVFRTEQIYPEYLVLYDRVYGEAS